MEEFVVVSQRLHFVCGRELSKLLRSVADVPAAASALRLLSAQQIVMIHSDPSRSRLAGTVSADAAIKETCAPRCLRSRRLNQWRRRV
jgi:hypothetical protein